jgi:hypothetical protein
LRHSYGIPGIIGEASFFSHPSEENRLKSKDYNTLEAQAHVMALEEFFSVNTLSIKEKSLHNQFPPFPVLQESQRMDPIALLWKKDYDHAVSLFNSQNHNSLNNSYNLFGRSIKSFPDSWVAGRAHMYRAQILEMQKKFAEAEMEKRRIAEYYIDIN